MYQLQNRSPPTAAPRATSPSPSHARSNVDSCHQEDMTAERRVSGADMSYIFREYSGRLKLYYWETAQNQKVCDDAMQFLDELTIYDGCEPSLVIGYIALVREVYSHACANLKQMDIGEDERKRRMFYQWQQIERHFSKVKHIIKKFWPIGNERDLLTIYLTLALLYSLYKDVCDEEVIKECYEASQRARNCGKYKLSRYEFSEVQQYCETIENIFFLRNQRIHNGHSEFIGNNKQQDAATQQVQSADHNDPLWSSSHSAVLYQRPMDGKAILAEYVTTSNRTDRDNFNVNANENLLLVTETTTIETFETREPIEKVDIRLETASKARRKALRRKVMVENYAEMRLSTEEPPNVKKGLYNLHSSRFRTEIANDHQAMNIEPHNGTVISSSQGYPLTNQQIQITSSSTQFDSPTVLPEPLLVSERADTTNKTTEQSPSDNNVITQAPSYLTNSEVIASLLHHSSVQSESSTKDSRSEAFDVSHFPPVNSQDEHSVVGEVCSARSASSVPSPQIPLEPVSQPHLEMDTLYTVTITSDVAPSTSTLAQTTSQPQISESTVTSSTDRTADVTATHSAPPIHSTDSPSKPQLASLVTSSSQSLPMATSQISSTTATAVVSVTSATTTSNDISTQNNDLTICLNSIDSNKKDSVLFESTKATVASSLSHPSDLPSTINPPLNMSPSNETQASVTSSTSPPARPPPPSLPVVTKTTLPQAPSPSSPTHPHQSPPSLHTIDAPFPSTLEPAEVETSDHSPIPSPSPSKPVSSVDQLKPSSPALTISEPTIQSTQTSTSQAITTTQSAITSQVSQTLTSLLTSVTTGPHTTPQPISSAPQTTSPKSSPTSPTVRPSAPPPPPPPLPTSLISTSTTQSTSSARSLTQTSPSQLSSTKVATPRTPPPVPPRPVHSPSVSRATEILSKTPRRPPPPNAVPLSDRPSRLQSLTSPNSPHRPPIPPPPPPSSVPLPQPKPLTSPLPSPRKRSLSLQKHSISSKDSSQSTDFQSSQSPVTAHSITSLAMSGSAFDEHFELLPLANTSSRTVASPRRPMYTALRPTASSTPYAPNAKRLVDSREMSRTYGLISYSSEQQMESERSVQESTDRTHDLLKIECTKDEKPISSQVEDRQKQDEVESEEKLAVEQQGITEGQQLTASVAASDQNSVSEQLKCRPTTTTSDSEPSPSISEVRNTTATRGNGRIALTVKESENSEGTKQESVLTKNLKLYSKMLEDQDDSTESSFEQEEPDHSCKTFMEKKVMPRIAAIMSNVDKECDTSLASELATSWVRIDGAHESEELRTDEERREHEEQSEKKLTKIVRGEINVESDGAMAQTNLIVWNSQDESTRSEVQGKTSEIEAVALKTREDGGMSQMERKEDTNSEDTNEEAKELDDLVIAVSEDVRGHLEEKGANIADEHSTNQLNTSNPRTEVTQTSIYRIPTYPTSEVTERHNFGLLRSDSDHDNTESILRRSEDKRDENLSEEPILLPTYLRNKTEQQSGSVEHGSGEIDSTTSNIGLLDGLKQSFRQESSSVNNYTDDGDNKQTVSSNIKRDVEFLESLQEELEEEQNKSDEQQDQAHSTIAQTAAENLEENFTEQRYSFGAIQEAPENSANEESSSGARFVPLPQDLLMAKSALRHVSDTAKESTTDSIVGGSSGATYTKETLLGNVKRELENRTAKLVTSDDDDGDDNSAAVLMPFFDPRLEFEKRIKLKKTSTKAFNLPVIVKDINDPTHHTHFRDMYSSRTIRESAQQTASDKSSGLDAIKQDDKSAPDSDGYYDSVNC